MAAAARTLSQPSGHVAPPLIRRSSRMRALAAVPFYRNRGSQPTVLRRVGAPSGAPRVTAVRVRIRIPLADDDASCQDRRFSIDWAAELAVRGLNL